MSCVNTLVALVSALETGVLGGVIFGVVGAKLAAVGGGGGDIFSLGSAATPLTSPVSGIVFSSIVSFAVASLVSGRGRRRCERTVALDTLVSAEDIDSLLIDEDSEVVSERAGG